MHTYKTLQFKVTLGIHRRTRFVEETGEHVFDTKICHTATFESGLVSLPLNTSEIPYRLLMSAQAKAEELAEAYEGKWSNSLPTLGEGREWDNKPVWRGGGRVLECYRYWYDAFQ